MTHPRFACMLEPTNKTGHFYFVELTLRLFLLAFLLGGQENTDAFLLFMLLHIVPQECNLGIKNRNSYTFLLQESI